MAIPNHSMQPVSSADLPVLADFVHGFKLALPINRLLYKHWPNDAAQKPQYARAVESAFHDPTVECLKVVDDSSGEIVGYLALSRRQRQQQPEPAADQGDGAATTPQVPDGMNAEVLAAVMAASEEIDRATEGVEHFEVTYVCVKPTSQRRGIGSLLLQVCFDRARAAGLPLGTASEPAAHDFFVKLGFKGTRHVDMDLSRWAPAYSGFGVFRLSGMIWAP